MKLCDFFYVILGESFKASTPFFVVFFCITPKYSTIFRCVVLGKWSCIISTIYISVYIHIYICTTFYPIESYIYRIYINISYHIYIYHILNHIESFILWVMISLDDSIWGAPHLFKVDEARKAPGAFLRALAEHTGTVRVRLVDNGFFANWLQVPQKNRWIWRTKI